jgi:uncharacterized protein YndB with AHSA1/START domain
VAAITITIVVERLLAEVFAFVTDARNNPLWQASAGLRESLQRPADPVGVGTQITEVWCCGGEKSQVISEVTAYEPRRRYTRHLLSGSSPITQITQVFEPVANGTQWTSYALVQSGDEPGAESSLVETVSRALEASMAEANALLERRGVDKAR